MKAPAGHKYIIVLTLPSGSKFACGGHEGKLALIPIGDGTKGMQIKQVLAFDDSVDVSKWMKKLMAQMSHEDKKNFLRLRPDLALISVAQ